MELVLNLVWVLLTATMAVLWLRFSTRVGGSRRTQVVALIALLLLLFPVISVSDDLLALQNPAEVDCCGRRGHVAADLHVDLHPAAILAQPMAAAIQLSVLRIASPGEVPSRVEDNACLSAIQNRPPPQAA
jgi:hypothetical protein